MANKVLSLQIVEKQDIIYFMKKEKRSRIKDIDFDVDLSYLNYDDDSFNFTILYFIKLNNEIGGFCIVCSFQTNVLNRIYIKPKYRNSNLATFAIEQLQIKNLCCFSDNIAALNLYRKLGFKIIKNNGVYSVSMVR